MGNLWRALAVVVLLAPAATAADDLAARIDAVIDGPDYQHAPWGVLVVDAKTGQTVYERNPDKLFAPASVTKLFSCAAALVGLGPDRTYETRVYRRGEVADGTLRGDLILVAGGDLMLGGRTDRAGKTAFKNHDHTYANSGLTDAELTDTDPAAGLNDLARQVKAAGVAEIDGEVLLDDRLFAKTRGSGSGPDLVTPVVVNDNVIDILLEPGAKAGDPAAVRTRPASAYYTLDAVVSTGPAGSAVRVQAVAVGPQLVVRGQVPATGKPLVRIYPVEDPALFARALFVESLRRAGVKVLAPLARPTRDDLPPADGYDKLAKVASFQSPPLKDLVAVTLKVSHNLYASTLPCLLAVDAGKNTAEAGLQIEGKLLRKIGVPTEGVSFGGGAGGSNADFTSPRATVALLQGMAKRPEWGAYKAGLPVLGVDGTLADVVPADSPARGKVSAKTGTLIWWDAVNERWLLRSKALAGVATTKSGDTLYFAMFVNNVPLPAGVNSSREGKVLGKLCEILYESR